MSKDDLFSNEFRPRLCHLRQRADFNGYGFNLHSERSQSGQFIGKVDPNSPAEEAGLRENDRIVEVNGASVKGEYHREVVARIKEGVVRNGVKHLDELMLLVVDRKTDQYYRDRNIEISSSNPNIDYCNNEENVYEGEADESVPNTRIADPPTSQKHIQKPSTPPLEYRKTPDLPASPVVQKPKDSSAYLNTKRSDQEQNYRNKSDEDEPRKFLEKPTSFNNDEYLNAESPPKPSRNRILQPSSSSGTMELPILNQSAAEYLQRLKEKNQGKRDIRETSKMGMKDKYDYINQL